MCENRHDIKVRYKTFLNFFFKLFFQAKSYAVDSLCFKRTTFVDIANRFNAKHGGNSGEK